MKSELIGYLNTINKQKISIDDFDSLNNRCFGSAYNRMFVMYEKLFYELQNYKPLYKLLLDD
jgi:hypothetical protein